jgi:hypothetical protein
MDKLNRQTLARALAGRRSQAAGHYATVNRRSAHASPKAARAFRPGRAAAAIEAFIAARERGENPSFPQKARRPAKG